MTKVAILTPCLMDGDAVGNDAVGMYDSLVRNNYTAHLFADNWSIDKPLVSSLADIKNFINQPDDLIIYHHSIGWDGGLDILRTLNCKKVIKYHNVTPSNFFENINTDYANACQIGRAHLQAITDLNLDLYISDSAYNAQEICNLGIVPSKSRVLPPFHHIDRLDSIQASLDIIDRFQDEKVNILMVGRIAPNKGHLALIQAFTTYYYGYNSNSRLLIVGKPDERLNRYTNKLQKAIELAGLEDAIIFTGGVSDAELKAYYLVANLFAITSDHEGFCVPLVESMAMKLPIIAYASTAIPGTLGEAGIAWETPDPHLLAASIHYLMTDEPIRFQIGELGWNRYQKTFTNQCVEEKFLRTITEVLNTSPSQFPLVIPAAPQHLRQISTPEELDEEIARCDALISVSADAFSKAVSEFYYVVNEPYPTDPYSQEYFDFQHRLYREISGRESYSITNEKSPFDLETAKIYPYPYFTKDATVVSNQLIAQGFLIKVMNLPPGSRIVEFGPGWGNTTLHMLQMGYEVTAVDAEPNFLELIRHRAGNLADKITLVCQNMTDFHSDQKYDAAVFFECFHHCSDHIRLLKNLHALLKDNGIIAFAAEPITPLYYPWGLRLDGLSVYSIRKYSWLELGFDTNYFMQTLDKLGWTAQCHESTISPLANIIIARKK